MYVVQCYKCGYQITGLRDLTCPECGADVSRPGFRVERRRRRVWMWWFAAGMVVCAGAAPLSGLRDWGGCHAGALAGRCADSARSECVGVWVGFVCAHVRGADWGMAGWVGGSDGRDRCRGDGDFDVGVVMAVGDGGWLVTSEGARKSPYRLVNSQWHRKDVAVMFDACGSYHKSTRFPTPSMTSEGENTATDAKCAAAGVQRANVSRGCW